MFQFSPYCAEFEMVTIADGVETRWPRRPRSELTRSIKRVKADGAFVNGIVLYNDHDKCLRQCRTWLEGRWALGHNLVMKKRPSQEYEELWDAILLPCSGPVVVDGRWAGGRARISQAGVEK